MRYIERQKTLNFLQDVTVGFDKPPGFNACALAVESYITDELTNKEINNGHYSYHHPDPPADRWPAGLPALQKLGLRAVRYHRRSLGGAVDLAVTRQDINTKCKKKEALVASFLLSAVLSPAGRQ
jgi:hypothetical protein